MKNRRIIATIVYLVLLVAVFAWVSGLFTQSQDQIPYSEVLKLFQNQQVKSFVVDDDVITMNLYEPYAGQTTVTATLADTDRFRAEMDDLFVEQYNSGVLESFHFRAGKSVSAYDLILPLLIVGLVLLFVWGFMMGRANNNNPLNNFGKARTVLGVPDGKKVTFADVAGADEEKEELQEIVDFLKNPEKFTEIGARIPHGLLLVGPPGTGKTLLARAVAGEAGVQFLSISGSDFVEMYVGVGASRVRDLFEQAKKLAPAIVFIDEIDAVGRKRGTGLGGGHDEKEQTLNQLLVEMDGFGNNEGVIVMAATNRADILDNALLRPGRFDRQVYVGLPDIRGREAILKIHSRDKHLAEDVDLNSIAKGTPGFAGADLENLMNEAALLAVRRKHRFITMEDIDEAILKVQMGPEKKSRKMSEKARRLTAYHEAGHAVCGRFLEHVDPVHYITIIPRGAAGGFTLFRPQEDLENFKSRSEMFESIVMALGGRMAEKLFLDDISTGASGDIQQASSIARDMVMRYGMSDRLGPILYDSSDHSIFIGRDFGTTKSYSEETAGVIDEEVKNIFDSASALCEKILTEHREQLIAIAEYLLQHETMEAEEFNYFFEHGEFMPISPKAARQAANDSTIERPARKISMTDGYAEENKTLPEAEQEEKGEEPENKE